MEISLQTRDFYQFLVENSSEVFQLVDSGLMIQFTSNAVENMLGYEPHELLLKNVIELVHPDDKEIVQEWLINLRKQPERQISCQYRLKNKRGEWIWIENNGKNLLFNSRIKSIVFSFKNIQAQKIVDKTLVQVEQRLSLLLNNTEESFIILNSRLRIITYNKAAQKHSPKFFIQELQSGQSFLDLVEKSEAQEFINLFENVFLGKSISKETTYNGAENEYYVFNHTYRPLFNEDQDILGVIITSSDITERKKLTDKLAENSEILKTAQNLARLCYFEYDFILKVFNCTEDFYKLLEIDRADNIILNVNVLGDFMHPEDRQRVIKEFEKSKRLGVDFNTEFRILNQSGQEKVILAQGGVVKNESGELEKFRVTMQDITDVKTAINALQSLESKFKSLFENSIDGVLLTSSNGEIISANPALCQMLGYSQEEIINMEREDLVNMGAPENILMVEERERHGSFKGEVTFLHRDGRTIPTDVTSIKMKDANNSTYISTIIRDITEKKKIEKEQEKLTEELVKNNQDLQQFSFITSHNLRAPVANLMSLLSLYNKENPADEFNEMLLEKFEESTQQLNQTLNDLLNVLVIKSNKKINKEPISFSTVYNDVEKNIQSLLCEQSGRIECDFSEINEVEYNKIHLESIFQNFITNAIRYRSPERAPFIKIKSWVTNDWIVVDFKDNGLGINLKRYGDRLFGLYQRFHENIEGKGLGLYMTKSQVMAMGGKIEVESIPGEGTTFSIYFKK